MQIDLLESNDHSRSIPLYIYTIFTSKLLQTTNKCVSTHRKGPVVSEDQNCVFAIILLNCCSFISILVQKLLKSDIAFLRYGNFIEDVITDWWKFDFEKKALKIWESVQRIGILGNSEVNFDTKTLLLHQVLQVILRLSIEDSKACEISKSTLGLYFEIFWLCIPITQNLVFR